MQDALSKITHDLVYKKIDIPATDREIRQTIKKHLTDAFVEVKGISRTKLYSIFKIHFETEDKLGSVDHHLSQYLTNLNLFYALDEALEQCTTSNILSDVTEDPLGGIESMFNVTAQKISPLILESNRYPQPWRFVSSVVAWCLNLGMIIGSIGVGITVLSIHLLVSTVDKLIVATVNKLFQGQYNHELRTRLPVDYNLLKQDYFDKERESLKKANPTKNIQEWSDDDIVLFIINQELERNSLKRKTKGVNSVTFDDFREIEKYLDENILATHKVIGFEKLQLIFWSIINSGTRSNNPVVNFFLKLIAGFGGIMLLGGAVISEILSHFCGGFIIVGFNVATLYLTSTLMLVNLPLYVFDFYLWISISNNTVPSHAAETTIPQTDINKDPASMQALGKAKKSYLEQELSKNPHLSPKHFSFYQPEKIARDEQLQQDNTSRPH